MELYATIKQPQQKQQQQQHRTHIESCGREGNSELNYSLMIHAENVFCLGFFSNVCCCVVCDFICVSYTHGLLAVLFKSTNFE